MNKNEANYIYSDLDDKSQNIHLAKVDKDLYYVSCKNLRGNFYINFASTNIARVNYHKLNGTKNIRVESRTGCTLNFKVLSSDKFNIVCTCYDYKQIISRLRKQEVINKKRTNQQTFSR